MAFDPTDPDFQDQMEVALLDAMRGDPPGPLLAQRLQRTAQDVLARAGCQKARIEARSDRSGTAVRISVPDAKKQVRQIVLTLG